MGSRSTTQTTKIDPALSRQSKKAMDFAELVATLPFSPNLGVTMAGFTPQQLAAQDAANAQAAAFGLPSSGQSAAQTMPATQMSPSGIAGYSIKDDYEWMRNASMPPELQQFIMSMFRDPNNPNAAPTNPMVPFGRRGQSETATSGQVGAASKGSGSSDYDNSQVPMGEAGGGWGALSGLGNMLGNAGGLVSSAFGFGRGDSAGSSTGGGK